MTTENAPTEEKQSPLVAGVIGSLLGLVVMFFPPHFVTLFFAPWIGGIVGGMRAHAKGTDVFVIGPVIGSVLALIAGIGIGVMMLVSSRGEGTGMSGLMGQVDNPALVVLGIAGLWVYATFCGALGGLIGGWLKRIG